MDNLNNNTIAIIGAGHMGKSMMQGLLQGGFAKDTLFVSNSASDNKNVVEQAAWVLLTVKPMLVETVLKDLGPRIHNKLIISAAAGLPIAKIASFIQNPEQKIIRIMPNLPVAYQQGVIGLWANTAVTEAEKRTVVDCFATLGTVIECTDEDGLDALTIVSGCGPAIAAYCISLLTQAGEAYGLPKETAAITAVQTFQGTLTYLHNTKQSAAELQASVATKGGITEQIIQNLDNNDVKKIFVHSLQTGYKKIKQLNEAP